MGVARVAAGAQNGLWASGATAGAGPLWVDSTNHVRAARTARRRHIPDLNLISAFSTHGVIS